MEKLFPVPGACHQENNRCTFSVWAPEKKKIELVIGLDKQKFFEMEKDELGVWSLTLNSIVPNTRYFYRVDGDQILPDPASRYQPDGVHGASAVVEREYPWTDRSWVGIALRDMVIYELHVGTFSEDGTFDGVIKKLPYLKELGVNAIELMPIAQFPGNRNWGYDGVFPYAAQNSYGGPLGLKKLVDEAHRHGIAVILDVVYNHQGPEGNYFSAYAPYFTDRYKTFWGSAINFDDAYCDGVRNFYWNNALMWLDEFHIDGLRMDAVHAIWDFSATHFIEELTQQVRELEKRSGRKKVLIAEFDLNNPRYINDPSIGGYGMDGQWIDEYHHALHALITGETDGYYEDFGSAEHLSKAIKDSYVYTGQYSKHRKKFFGRFPEHNAYSQFVIFTQNHDQVGNRMLGDRLTTQLSFEALKLAAASILTAPQVPMLFMGEEYGEKNPFQYFISHTDKELVEMVREGRKKEFSYFNWKGEVPDPQGEETFNACVLSGGMDKQQKKLFELYRYLITLRKTHTAFQSCEPKDVSVHEPVGKIVSFERKSASSAVLVVLNFDKATVPYTVPETIKSGTKIFDSASLEWGGPGEITKGEIASGAKLLVQPQSTVIFEIQ